MIRVQENLYFSPKPGALILRPIARQFTRVLNVSDKETKYPSCFDPKRVEFKTIPMTDEGDMLMTAENAADYIHKVLIADNKILVHCEQGVNRSPFVVLYYLRKYEAKKTVEEYLKELQLLKPLSINPPWLEQLRAKFGE